MIQFSGVLGVEQVGEGDDFLLDAGGYHVAAGEWEVLGSDVVDGQSDADVAFADQRMAVEPFGFEDGAAVDAVGDVGGDPEASDARRVGHADADVVEHGSLLDEREIDSAIKAAADLKGLLGDAAAV